MEQYALALKIRDELTPKLENISRQIEAMDRKARKSTRSMGAGFLELASTIKTAAGAVGLYMGAQQALSFGWDAVKEAGKWESMETSIARMEGSAGRAANVLDQLTEAAKGPGVGLEQIQKGYLAFKGLGYEAEQSVPIFRELGNAIALTGGSAENFEGVSRQFTQMIPKGRILQEEISIIAEHMPNLSSLMQQAFGTTNVEAIRAMGVGAREFVAKITEAASEMPRAADGITNSIDNMTTAWSRFKASLVDTDAAKNGIRGVTALLEGLTASMSGGIPKLEQDLKALEEARSQAMGQERYRGQVKAIDEQINGVKALIAVEKQQQQQSEDIGRMHQMMRGPGKKVAAPVDPKVAEEAKRRREKEIEEYRRNLDALRAEGQKHHNALMQTDASMAAAREERILEAEAAQQEALFARLETENALWAEQYATIAEMDKAQSDARIAQIEQEARLRQQMRDRDHQAAMSYIAAFGNATVNVLTSAYFKAKGENASFLTTALEGFRAMLEQMVVEMAARAAVFAVLNAVTGGQAGVFSQAVGGPASFIFGGRASGGFVQPGASYVVGEHRRERFVPDGPGRVAPTAAGPVTINVAASPGMDTKALAREIVRAQEDATRRRLRGAL